MKVSPSKTSQSGFSLIELIVVICVLITIMGLVLGAIPGVMNRVNRNKVEAFIAELSRGLNAYQIDHGIYPQNPASGGDRNQAGLRGSSVLYKHLSGDWDLDGKWDGANNASGPNSVAEADAEKVYVPNLIPGEKSSRSTMVGGEFMVTDTFGEPIRYLADPPNISEANRSTFNPTFDLWSLGGVDPNDSSLESNYISNWQN